MVDTTKSKGGKRKETSANVPEVNFDALKHLLIADLEMVEAEKRRAEKRVPEPSRRYQPETRHEVDRVAAAIREGEAVHLLRTLQAQAEALRRENEVIRSLATAQQKRTDLSAARTKEQDLLMLLAELKSEVETIKGQKEDRRHAPAEVTGDRDSRVGNEVPHKSGAALPSASGPVRGVLQHGFDRLKALAAAGHGYFSTPIEQEATIDDARWGLGEMYYEEKRPVNRNLWRGAAAVVIAVLAVGSGYLLIQMQRQPVSPLSSFGISDQPELSAPLASGEHRLGAYAEQDPGSVTVATSAVNIEEAPGSRTTEVAKDVAQ